ncbi:MAG: hypothetical protein KGJ07_00210 [Patescibacteria group bacterium]|nr:hypothetical protein [Patescibacteria group bacterium]
MLEDLKLKDLLSLVEILKPIKTNVQDKKYNGYKIVRTYSAGVFAGYIESRNGREVVMKNARRLWQWAGAASLSQLAMEGTKSPENCKFPCEVQRIELLEVIEILDCTEKAEKSIKEVSIWKI